jgi:TolA-binding protein
LLIVAAESALMSGANERCWRYCDALLEQELDRGQQLAAQRLWIRAQTAAGNVGSAWQRLSEVVALPDVDQREWAELALAVGFAALTHNEPAIAAIVFRWYLEHGDPQLNREMASLGLAWAAAQGAEPYEQAARRLLDFVESYPNNANVPQALLTAGACYVNCNQNQLASDVYRRIISNHRQSPVSQQALGQLLMLEPAFTLDADQLELLRETLTSQALTPALLSAALRHADDTMPGGLWHLAIERMVSSPESQALVLPVLQDLDQRQRVDLAERLAVQIVNALPAEALEPGTEHVCRWASLHHQWAMLAAIASSDTVAQRRNLFSNASNRLLAEGLMQVGRQQEAKVFLDQLIVQQGVTDFETLLRRAEIALSVESKSEAATAIERLVPVASTANEKVLASLLRAQWFVRNAQLDDARSILHEVLRGEPITTELQARTQWMIGETHLLQRQFNEAVDAYRLVEKIDAHGQWSAASLVQAGRAFELMGRPRDAAVCYTGLLRKFADSPYAQVARERLASLGTTSKLR